MSGVEIRQRAASEGQSGGRRGQEGWPAPLHRASWSTVPIFVRPNCHHMLQRWVGQIDFRSRLTSETTA